MSYRSFTVSFLILTSLAMAQRPIPALSFLAGRWVASSPNGWQEESWSPALGANVVGTFRVVESDHAVFFEFWSVEERDGKTVMLLKHYNAGLKGWESKDVSTELPLVKFGPNMAEFSSGDVTLHYQRNGDDLVAVVKHMRNGKASTESFRMKKAPLETR